MKNIKYLKLLRGFVVNLAYFYHYSVWKINGDSVGRKNSWPPILHWGDSKRQNCNFLCHQQALKDRRFLISLFFDKRKAPVKRENSPNFVKMAALQKYSLEEVSKHNEGRGANKSVWTVIHDNVYDVTKFLDEVSFGKVIVNVTKL